MLFYVICSLEFSLVTANAWEEGDEVILITCRLENPDLDKVNGYQSDNLENFGNELYVPTIQSPFKFQEMKCLTQCYIYT